MSEDYQALIDEVSQLVGTPATLEGRDFALIAFGAHGGGGEEGEADGPALDSVRTRTILQRRSTPAVRAFFESFGITRATGPVRVPPPGLRRGGAPGPGDRGWCTAASACRCASGAWSTATSGCWTTGPWS